MAIGLPFVTGHPAPSGDRWVRETRLGTWFLGTDIWLRYVLEVAVADLERLLGPRSGPFPAILDVGCGHGQALPILEAKFRPDVLVGIDVDPAAIARAEREAARCRCRVELEVGSATRLDAADGSFDMVFCHQTVHHLADPERGIRELHRVLKPGGVLLLSESCRPFTLSWPVRLLFRHPVDTQKSAEEYLGLLRAAGFAFGREDVALPYPWWSRPDLGLREWLGRPVPADRQETVLTLVAVRRELDGFGPAQPPVGPPQSGALVAS